MKKLILLAVVASSLMLSSCYKESENGVAKITIYSNVGHLRVPNVDVHLFGPPGSYIDRHFITDQMGEVIYEHDPALEVVLKVHATITDGSGFREAKGIIRITPDKV